MLGTGLAKHARMQTNRVPSGFLFVTIWLIVIHATLTFFILSPASRRTAQYITVSVLAIAFLLVYLLMFIF